MFQSRQAKLLLGLLLSIFVTACGVSELEPSDENDTSEPGSGSNPIDDDPVDDDPIDDDPIDDDPDDNNPSTPSSNAVLFDWPASAETSELYSAKVTDELGNEFPLTIHISEPNLNVDPLYPDETDGVTGYMEDRTLSFVQFDFEGSVQVEVTKDYGEAATRVEIQPKSLGIEPYFFDGTTVRFQLDHSQALPNYVSVNFMADDNLDADTEGGFQLKHAMMIFADKPETNQPDKTDEGVVIYSNSANLSDADIIYFEAGDYDLTERFTDTGEVGQMPFTKDNQRVYLEGGAIVRGAFHGKEFDGLWIYGRGIITGRDLAWHWFRDETGEKDAFVNLTKTEDAYLEGFILENPTHHSIPTNARTTIKNIKILGWASNHDGIRPAEDSTVEQIFVKTSDDYDYSRDPHTVSDSIFWPAHNGATGMLGWGNLGDGFAEYHNNAYINSETRAADKDNTGIVGSVADDGIMLEQNHYENLYIEDKHAYLVNVVLETVNGGIAGYLRDFTFKNIRTERPFMLTNNTLVKQRMRGVENNWLEGWTFTNLIVAGELVTWQNYQDFFDLELTGSNGNNEDASKFVRNITFNTEGTIFEISVNAGTGGVVYPEGVAGTVQVAEGMSQMLNIVPNSGFKIEDVIVDGESLGRIQTVILDDVQTNHNVSVTFSAGTDYYDKGLAE